LALTYGPVAWAALLLASALLTCLLTTISLPRGAGQTYDLTGH
jgi:DHA1 family bicyclomycin/chloramphenicol resistance-like MFS transporter